MKVKTLSFHPSRPHLIGLHRQRGQALIYGVFVLVAGLAALFFLFNAGQLSAEKTKLVNTADAVAYSAGVMHARALNFDAYNNRALVANEVLVAQMVSLSSWSQYAQTHAENLVSIFPECADPYGFGAGAGALLNYGPLYAAMCYLTVQYAGEYVAQLAEQVPLATKMLVSAVEVNKLAIKAAQLLLHAPGYFQHVRGAVMQEVADSNYRNDGSVEVEPAGEWPTVDLTDNWGAFAKRYAGNDRARFAETAKLAAYRDDFVKERGWTASALTTDQWKCLARGRTSEVRRRGGTELIGYDEWKAEDTESFWRVRNAGRPWQIRCNESENPIAWGEQQAHAQDEDESGAFLGGSPSTNPNAHGKASSNAWTNYTGLPAFYDLDPEWLAKSDPRLQFSARVVRTSGQTRTSGNRSQIPSSARLNTYQNNFANGEMAAVSSSEVFFERPITHRENLFGKSLNPSKPREIGSLFNPYWQVRLIHSDADTAAQRSKQMQ